MANPLEELIQQLQLEDEQEQVRVPPVPLANIEAAERQKYPEGYKEIVYEAFPERTFTGKSSLTDLANDEEFSTRAARFLEGIGSNDNIFEYLRDADYSLSSAITRSFQTGKWTPEQIEDYNYLKNAFDNTELSGFKERFGAFKDIAVDILADPLNIVSALFALPSGGSSLALSTAAKAGVSKVAKAAAQDKLKGLAKDQALKQGLLYGATEGAAWGGLHNYFLQDIDIDLGLKEDMDLSDIGASTLVGAAFTGALAGGTRYMSTRFTKAPETNENMSQPLKDKEFVYSNEDAINKAGDAEPRAKVVKDTELDEAIEAGDDLTNEKDFIEESKNKLNWWLARTIGKPVTEFIEYIKKAPSLENILASIRYDYGTSLTKGQKGVTKVLLTDGTESTRTYGESLGLTNGYFQFGLAKAFNVLYRVGWRARIFKEQNDQLAYLLRDGELQVRTKDGKNVTGAFIEDFVPSEYTITTRAGQNILGTNYKGFDIDEDVVQSYLQIKQLLNKAFIDGKSADIFKKGTGRVTNYLPRIFKHSVLSNPQKRAVFEQKLIESGHADPINDKQFLTILDTDGKKVRGIKEDALGLDEEVFGVNFLEEAGGDQELAKKLKASKIVQDMLDYRYTPLELRMAGKKRSDATGFLQSRRFTNIADNEIEEFLENDVQVLLENYFTNFSQTLTRAKYFGKTIAEVEKNKIAPIVRELIDSGMNPDEAYKVGRNVSDMIKRVTGLETYSDSFWKKNAWGRNFSDWGKLSQQMAHLPFATLSSVTEPLLLLSRAGKRDAPVVIADIGKALVKEGQSVIDRTLKGIQRGVFRQKVKGIKDIDDEVWSELYKTGLALEQSVQERLEGLVGEGIHGEFVKNLQQGFFKVNLLTQWTKAVQLASFTTGKRLITRNAELLSKGGLGKGKDKYLRQQLNDLGIDDIQAAEWYGKYVEDGKFNFNLAKEDAFYKNDLTIGANRFVKEIILNPSTAEANRPLWFSTPAAQMLVQFAGYPTVFNNTILKRFAYEGKSSFMQVMPKAVPTILLMTAVAHVGNIIRSNGQSVYDYETKAPKPDGEIIMDAVRRWGGMGPFDYAYRYGSEADRNVGGFTSLTKTFAGPLPQDAIDAILYRKGLAEIVFTNLPGYAAYDMVFGDGTKKELRRMARGTPADKPKKPVLYAKGGLVYDVPNVTDEPDEMKSRVTGIPFNATAEFVQDEEDRALKGQMSRLGFEDGGFVEEALDTLLEEARARKQQVYDYLKSRQKEFGYSDEAIFGLMGNIDKETGIEKLGYKGSFDYKQQQEDGPGYGLFQLDPGGSHVSEYNKFRKLNNREDSMEAQLDYMLDSVYNLKSSAAEKNGIGNSQKLQEIFKTGSAEDIAVSFTERWERPRAWVDRNTLPDKWIENKKDRMYRSKTLKNEFGY